MKGMSSSVEVAVATYVRAASERDADRRARLLDTCLAEDARFVTRSRVYRGRAEIAQMLARGLSDPELVGIRIASAIDAQGTTFRYRAVADRRDGSSAESFDAGEIDSNGQICLILAFAGALADASSD